jgi:carboxymethylenebutenolidase
MQASLLAPDKINATIQAYCRMETNVERLKGLNGPVLAIYAQQERNWPRKQADFEAAHGFTNPTSPRYDKEADKASWACIVNFLKRNISVTQDHISPRQ